MRLFRQKRWGDWAEVFQRMARELEQNQAALAAPILPEIAPGELLDKITILEIKRQKARDESKLQHIRVELGGLVATRARSLRPSRALDRLTARLKVVNEELWQIEDEIRLCELRQDFGEGFIALARSVYKKNDERAQIKRHVNEQLGSRIREEKSYTWESAPAEGATVKGAPPKFRTPV